MDEVANSQKLPKYQNIDWSLRPERAEPMKRRLELLVQGLAEGKTFEEMALRCGINRRTLYNDRSRIDTTLLAQELLQTQLGQIAELGNSIDPLARKAAMHFRDRIIQKLLPSKVISTQQGKIEIKEEVSMPGVSEADIARFVGTIVSVAMDHEAREPDKDDDQQDPTKPVDPKAPPP